MDSRARDSLSSNPSASSFKSVSRPYFSYIQPGAARKQDYENQQGRHRHAFEQSRSATNRGPPSRRQSSPVAYSQKSVSNASSRDDSTPRTRRPHSTLLPTPHILLPVKAFVHRSHIASQPNVSRNKRVKGSDIGVGIDRVRRRTLVSKSGASLSKGVRKRAQQRPDGPWLDKNGRLRNPDSDSDTMDLDQPSSSASDSDVEIVQSKLSARKTKSQRNEEDSPEEVGFSATISSDEESVEEGDDDQEEPVSDSESEQEQESGDPDVDVIGDNIGTESMSEPSVALIEAIKPFLPRIPARNLPFLKRNLRTAFKKSFSTSIGSPSGAVVLQVLLRASSDQSRWSFSLDSWSCPLCHLLGELDSRQMLDFHLQWHHPGVEVLWLREKDPEWRLILSFPVLSTSHIERPVAPYFRYAFIKKTVDIADHDAQGNQSITSLTMEDELDSDVDADISVRMSPVPTPKIEFASPSSISISLSPPRGRSITTAEGPHPTPLDPQYPLPPPADNPLGPAARYPYLPAISDDGKIVLHYSCRAGGPYLYDLLGLLPLDEYGVLSWLVLDREAEIFENEDISDECKVMHALWDRWIMMNRRRFIQDYLVGTIDFVDKYWLMIHRAAGWSALRYWLVMLMANRYLQANGVAHVLKHYEEKTGMKYWYNEYM